jgi:hypothetical protein
MTVETINGLLASGVLAQGFGVLVWAIRLEFRVAALERKGVAYGA